MIIAQNPPQSQQTFKAKQQLRMQSRLGSQNLDNIHPSNHSRVKFDMDLDFDQSSKDKDDKTRKVKMVRLPDDFLEEFPEVGEKMDNRQLKNNTFAFGILMLATQIGVCFVYGFKFNIVPLDSIWRTYNEPTFEPISFTILNLLAALIGFPMLFAYNRKMIWTALTFNLLILGLTIQLYFIANNLINRIGINPTLSQYSSSWQIYIWNYDYHYLPQNIYTGTFYQVFGNTLIDAIKCAISNMIIYSAVLGRVGILEVFGIVWVGTVGYQFCRQVLYSFGVDFGDGCCMWVYGGFAGFAIGLIQFFKNRRNIITSTKDCLLYTGSFYSTAFSMMGSTMLVVLLPILCIHPARSFLQSFPNILTNVPYTIYHSTAASILTSISTSIIINKKLVVRDFINGAIAGGIAGFNSAVFIQKIPAYAQVVGFTAGLLQALVQNFVEKQVAMRYDLFHSYSFCLFGIQGIVGAAYGSIFKSSTTLSTQPIILGFIAAGIGLAAGLVIGVFIFWRGHHRSWDNFHDKIYLSGPEPQPFKQDESVMFDRINKQNQFAPTPLPFE